MTDAQLAAIITATTAFLVGVGRFVRWMFTEWMTDRKEERKERKTERDATTQATIAVATAMTTMALKFEAFEKQLVRVEGAVDEVADEVTGRHEVPVLKSKRAQTDPGYRAPKRPPRQDT